MTFSFFRLAAVSFILGILSISVWAKEDIQVESIAVVLPSSADFSEGSAILTFAAQERLQVEVEQINITMLDRITATGLVNKTASNNGESLGLERARSLRAFFILNGIDPARIHVGTMDVSEQRNSRLDQVQFEFVEQISG
jgi:hypothetical protein